MTSPHGVHAAIWCQDSSSDEANLRRDLSLKSQSLAESSTGRLLARRESGVDSQDEDSAQQSSLDLAPDADRHHALEAGSQILSRTLGEISLEEELRYNPEESMKLKSQDGMLPAEDFRLQSASNQPANTSYHLSSRQTLSAHVDNLSGTDHDRLGDHGLDLKLILQNKMPKVEDVNGKRKRPRYSNLVFTRRFTVMDRYNNEGSLFWGFFTLFWLGTFFMVVKTGARNWSLHGSVFGGNEILTKSIQRDLLVLAITDGILCASTVFCLLLQRLILAGYLSWDRQGWIIQNVSYQLSLVWKAHQQHHWP